GPQETGLRFRVVRAEGADRDGPSLTVDEPGLKVIERAVSQSRQAGEIEWLTWVTQPDSDVLLRVDGRYAAIFPSIGRSQATTTSESRYPASLRGGWGPIDLEAPDAETHLLDLFRRIARARNLIRLSETWAAAKETAATSSVRLELVAVKLDD